MTAGYTYNDSKYLDEASLDTSASAFSQIAPKHLFRVWTNYRLPGDFNRWEVGGGINMTSKQMCIRDSCHPWSPGGWDPVPPSKGTNRGACCSHGHRTEHD